MPRHARIAYVIVLGSFLLSGVAGLIYQVVWTRYLGLFLGHTSYAVIAVLAAFMGGLALGNAWLGGVADRVKRPLLMYAGLELGIGVFALAFPQFFRLLETGFIGVVRATEPGSGLRMTLQFLFAGLAILVPTILMGATLPVLTRFVTRTLTELRGRVAALYAINSSGAVLGALFADWGLIPGFGLEVTLYVGATLSVVVGLAAWMTSRALDEGAAGEPPREDPAVERFTPIQLRLALAGIGVSGFVAMVYEVAWTRLLALSLGSSTHAYSLMLATFISGIAAGGWLVARWRRQLNSLVAFAWAELALGATLLVSLWFYDLLPWWFVNLSEHLSRGPGTFRVYELLQALICFGVMFVPAVCLGTTLPLVSRVATAEVSRTGRSVGHVFAVNTVGTVLGAILGGLVLLPVLGLARTFAMGIALNTLVGAMILAERHRRRVLAWAVPVGVLAVAWISASALQTRWQKAFALGIWRASVTRPTQAAYHAMVDSVELRFYRDGASSSVAVIADPLPAGGIQLSLRVNGKTDASSVGDMSTQVLMAHLPMLLKPGAREALVVGLGSGVTVGSLLRHPEVSGVDVVEISPDVVEVCQRFFGPDNGEALADRRVRLAVEDAKTFLQTTTRSYDIIATEPSNPWMAGVAGVFSREYYLDLRARLKPGGVVAQWLQAYEADDRMIDIVISTFSSVFPSVGIWQVGPGDLVLIGSVDPLKPDSAAMERGFALPGVREDLARVGISSLTSLLMLELVPQGAGSSVPENFPEPPIHSDFHPVLEYVAQQAFFERVGIDKLMAIAGSRQPRGRMLLSQQRPLAMLGPEDFRRSSEMYRRSTIPEPSLFRSQVRRWMHLEPGNLEALEWLSTLYQQVPSPEAPAVMLASNSDFAEAQKARNVPLMRLRAMALVDVHRAQRSAFYLPDSTELEQLLAQLIELDADQRRLHRTHLAELVWDRGDDSAFAALSARVFAPESEADGPIFFQPDPRAPAMVVLRQLLNAERQGNLSAAVQIVRGAVERGLLGQGARLRDQVLEYESRRILSVALANPGSSGLAAPGPASSRPPRR